MGDALREVLGSGRRFIVALGVTGRAKLWLCAWLAVLPYVIIRAENLAESDTFWQIRTGLMTIAQGRLPVVDPFSWTAQGKSWTLNSWGFNVILGLAYQTAGLVGVALTCSCLIAGIVGLVLFLARQLGATPFSSSCIILTGIPMLTLYLSARPQLVDYFAVVALVILLRRLVDEPKPVLSLLAIGTLTVLWVNLHSAALLGVAIVGASACAVLLKKATRAGSGRFLAALLVTLLASLANPYGAGWLAQTAQVKAASVAVVEWQPLNPADPLQIVLFAVGVLGLFLAVRRGEVVVAASLAVAACGSVAAMRVLPIFALLSLPVLASHHLVIRYSASRQKMLAWGGSVFLLFAAGFAIFNLPYFGRPDPSRFPVAAISAVPAGAKVFNEYDLGGYVILERPDARVSVDSRNDLYGADLVEQSGRVIAGQVPISEGLAGADCVLVRPESGLAHQLLTSAEWELASAESSAVLFIRR